MGNSSGLKKNEKSALNKDIDKEFLAMVKAE